MQTAPEKLASRIVGTTEVPTPQLFLLFTHSTRSVAEASPRLARFTRQRAARTLSREFWQSKNFRAPCRRLASALAKPALLRESRNTDSRRTAHPDDASAEEKTAAALPAR